MEFGAHMNARNPVFFLVLALLLAFGCLGPEAPSSLKATASASGVVLSWLPSQSANVAGYNVYRSEISGSIGARVNAALITSAAYTDSSAQNGKTYYYTVKAVNSGGSEDGNRDQVQVVANIMPPTSLSVSINNGAEYTKSNQVSLSLSATGADKCRFSNDGSSWSEWEAYSVSKTWGLDSADGLKNVYYQCENPSGILSDSASASITLMGGSMAIAITAPSNGDVLSKSFQVDFTVSGNAGSTSCVANADGINAPIGNIGAEETKFPLILNDGQHALYVSCTDQLGTAKSQNIHFETEENPLSFTINDGSPVTDYRQIKLYIHAPAGSQCRYSNDGSTWSEWESCPSVKDWTITTGDGQKTIYIQGKNSNGNSLGQVSDAITLDTTPSPEVYFSINNGETTTYSQTVKLSIHASYATECRYGNGNSYNSWVPYATTAWYTLSSKSGQQSVYVQCRNDKEDIATAMNVINYKPDSGNVPSGLSMIINGGSRSTSVREVTLTLSARGADECRFQNQGQSWSDWKAFQYTYAWTLSSGDGTKTVYYQCRNSYGSSDTYDASIILSTTNPTVSISAPVNGQTYDGDAIFLTFYINDPAANGVTCQYYCNGEGTSTGSVAANQQITRTLISVGGGEACGAPSGGQFSTYVTCTDDLGNHMTSSTVNFYWTKFVGPVV